jgi:hypothetical protein
MTMNLYYKAVDETGLSFFPLKKADRVNWVGLIGTTFALGNEEAWEEAVEKLRDGDTACCTKHLVHGYADIALAVDFGRRNDRGEGFRVIEFTGEPVAQLQGTLLLERVSWGEKPWNAETIEKFHDAVKYGFRLVDVVREVPEEEWT